MRIISFLAALFLLINIAAPANAQVVNVNVATATEDYEYYGQVTLLAPGNVSLPFPDPATAFVRGDLSGAFNAAIAAALLPPGTIVHFWTETAQFAHTETTTTIDAHGAIYDVHYTGDPDDPTTWVAIGTEDVNVDVAIVTTHYKAFLLEGTPAPPPITSLSPLALPDGTIGDFYDQTISAIGGGAPSFTIATGALPPGLALSPNGTLSGVPTHVGGPYNFTLRATDTYGSFFEHSYAIKIGRALPTLGISVSPTPPLTYGYSSVGITVVVNGSATTPSGNITLDGWVRQPSLTGTLNAAGEVTFPLTALEAGTHNLSVTYSGDSNYLPVGPELIGPITVNPETSLVLLSSTGNPSMVGEPVTFTAWVISLNGATIPEGEVTFEIAGVLQPPMDLDPLQTASFTTSALAPGSNLITARFQSDPNLLGEVDHAASEQSMTQIVNLNQTTTTLASSANPSVAGETVTFTATVTPDTGGGVPTGSVTFSVDGAAVATEPLAGGEAVFATSALPGGARLIEAAYSGDPIHGASSDTLTQTVNLTATTTTLASSANPGTAGEAITFTATVETAGGAGIAPPTGTVTFSFDGSGQPPVALDAGVATFTTADLAVGAHAVTAAYSGDTRYSASASAAFEQVIEEVAGTIVIRQLTDGQDGTFAFTSPQAALNLSITTVSGAGESDPVRLPPGTYAISARDLTGAGFGLDTIACDDADSTADLASRSASITLSTGEAVTCTFTSVHADTTSRMVEDFMTARGRMVLLARPDADRRMARLRGGASGGDPASALMSYLPVLANGGPASVSASLEGISRMADPQAAQQQFDLWASAGHFTVDGNGSYTAGTVGADYLATQDLLIGTFLMLDRLETTPSPVAGVEGAGWLAGGYVTARLSENLYLDLLAGGGASDNTITPLGTYEDSFTTSRLLAAATLAGDWRHGAWTFSPRAALTWYREDAAAYVDSLGVTIPATFAATGELALGPGIAWLHETDDGWTVTPGLRLDGVLRFTETPAASETEFLGRLEARLDFTAPGGATLGLSATADGIGASSPMAYGGALRIAVPLN